MRDLIGAYGARVMGVEPGWSPLAVQVADVALWEDEVLGSATDSGSVLGGELGFRRSALESVPELLALPTDFVRPAVASGARWAGGVRRSLRLADAIAHPPAGVRRRRSWWCTQRWRCSCHPAGRYG